MPQVIESVRKRSRSVAAAYTLPCSVQYSLSARRRHSAELCLPRMIEWQASVSAAALDTFIHGRRVRPRLVCPLHK